MENAVDALKMAFAIFVFVLAIGIAFAVFSQARAVSDIVLYYTDKTNFEQYVSFEQYASNASSSDHPCRIVGIETVVPAIRRYIDNNEGYYVELKDINGKTMYVYDSSSTDDEFLGADEKKAQIERDINEIIKNYRDKEFEEYFSATIYRGERFEGIETKNTDEKIKITYKLKN